jgi:putative colanic acid biosynthesis acetyltransferase WcaF
MEYEIDLSKYEHSFSLKNKISRALWCVSYILFFRPFSLNFFRSWRNFVLKIFGAKLHSKTNIYASVKIWAPWNLEMGAYSTLGPLVDCYNQGKITIGDNTTISQKAYLCASTHDFTDVKNNLILKPVFIESQVWVAADAFIGPGVTIKEGSVIGARAAVFKDVDTWSVVGGNPAKFIKKRNLK